jgi:hypothetical protein
VLFRGLAAPSGLSYILTVSAAVRCFSGSGFILAVAVVAVLGPSPTQDAARSQPEPIGVIAGTVSKSDGAPVGDASVRLRSLNDGRAAAETRTDPRGEFRFDVAAAFNPWVLEVVSDRQRVVAVSDVVTIVEAQTVTAALRVHGRIPWSAGYFNNSAAAAITAASSLGITAAGSNGTPVSPR